MTAVLPGFPGENTNEPLSLRYYQAEAIAAAYQHLRQRNDNPCIVLPTGAGKTPVMASICHDAVCKWDGRVLVLSHVKELIQQTADTLADWFPGLNVGVYSAGLNRRDKRSDVLVAGIQSVHKKGLLLAGSNPFNIVLVDEAHRIPTSGDGMYRNLLTDLSIASPTIRVIGLTATPYRLKGGYVCGPGHFLNGICYEAGVRELIVKGYLCPLTSKRGDQSIDTGSLGIRNGEFKSEDLEGAFDTESVVDAAVAEIVALTTERKSILLFCCSVEHADHVASRIAWVTGERCGMIHGDTPKGERDGTINEFKEGRLRWLVNVNVLTEGFDARRVDCVVLLRSTLSPGLYYQMVGRGLRTHESKINCLVLDYGGNVERHGCIDDIQIKSPSSRGGGGEWGFESPARTCPHCKEIVNAAYARCPECDFMFPEREEAQPNHEDKASETPITSDQIQAVRYEVDSVSYAEHIKRGADETDPRTMRVTYYEGLIAICDEWVCVEHGGFAGEKAESWWSARSHVPMPTNAAEAAELAELGAVAEPIAIYVRRAPGSRFQEIVRYEIGEKPDFDADGIETVTDEWGQEVRQVAGREIGDDEDDEKWNDHDEDEVPF